MKQTLLNFGKQLPSQFGCHTIQFVQVGDYPQASSFIISSVAHTDKVLQIYITVLFVQLYFVDIDH